MPDGSSPHLKARSLCSLPMFASEGLYIEERGVLCPLASLPLRQRWVCGPRCRGARQRARYSRLPNVEKRSARLRPRYGRPMRTSSGLPYRRSVRLPGWIYRGGSYFITICAHQRRCTFGTVDSDHVVRNVLGDVVEREWVRSKIIRPDVLFDDHIVMPNHMHAVVYLPSIPGRVELRRRSLSTLVGGFKGAVTRAARDELGIAGKVWQRGFHDHVIRNQRGLDRIRTYIRDNPSRWSSDRYNPDR